MEEKNGAQKRNIHDSLLMATFPSGSKDEMKPETWGVREGVKMEERGGFYIESK